MFRNQRTKAATTIQKHMRRVLAQKKYGIQHLKRNEMQFYPTFVVGNDPVMPTELNNYHEADKKIAFVATSGLRALSLVCKIGNQNNIPKLIVIDNSTHVCDFWVNFRAFVADDSKAATAELLLKNLPGFLRDNKHLYRTFSADAYLKDEDVSLGRRYLNQDIQGYVKALITKYDFDFVRAIVRHTSVIRQSWAHTATFAKVKNILAVNGIERVYAYPSNIVDCVDSKCEKDAVLKNIAKLTPVLSIHTKGERIPNKVYLLENNSPSHVSNTICSPCMFRGRATGGEVDGLSALLNQLLGGARSDNVKVVSVTFK